MAGISPIVTRGYTFSIPLVVTAGYLSGSPVIVTNPDIELRLAINRTASYSLDINRTAAYRLAIRRSLSKEENLTS